MIKELEGLLSNKTVANGYGVNNYYGVRLPLLRNIAKTIAKEKRYEFFAEKHASFEELTLHAYAIGYLKEDIDTCEFLIPTLVFEEIENGSSRVSVLKTNAVWQGVTYKEDKPKVVSEIKKLVDNGEYKEGLWN